MRSIRRNDHSPRVEMMPLIDVVFLLLTFFIYSLIVMNYTSTLNVRFTPAAQSAQAAQQPQVHAITIDKSGRLYYNRQPIEPDALSKRLELLAKDPDQPPIYVAMEGQGDGTVDRGPVYVDVLERIRSAGITKWVMVGQPNESNRAP